MKADAGILSSSKLDCYPENFLSHLWYSEAAEQQDQWLFCLELQHRKDKQLLGGSQKEATKRSEWIRNVFCCEERLRQLSLSSLEEAAVKLY